MESHTASVGSLHLRKALGSDLVVDSQRERRKEFIMSDTVRTAAPAERITPEMIEAGARILFSFDTFFEDERTWAVRVYRAMREAAKTEPPLED